MATPVYIPICFYYASPRSIQRESLSSSWSYYAIKAALGLLISLGDKYKALLSVYKALLNLQASGSVAGTTSCPPYPLKVKVKSLSRVRLFGTPWTIAHQAHPSMGFSRQECWSGLPFPSPGDLPDPGIELRSPALQADALPSEPPMGSQEAVKIVQQVSFTQFPQMITSSISVTQYQS